MEMFNMKEERQQSLQGRTGFRRKLRSNTVRLGVKKSGRDKTPTCQFAITPDVLNRLHWKLADKVNLKFNDDYCIIERDNGGYWKITKDGGSNNFLISFTPLAGKYKMTERTIKRNDRSFQVQDDKLIVAW